MTNKALWMSACMLEMLMNISELSCLHMLSCLL